MRRRSYPTRDGKKNALMETAPSKKIRQIVFVAVVAALVLGAAFYFS